MPILSIVLSSCSANPQSSSEHVDWEFRGESPSLRQRSLGWDAHEMTRRMHVNGLHGIIDLNEKARAYYCTIYSFTSQKEKKERTNRQTARPRFLDLFPSVVVVVVVVELLLTILDSTTTTFFSPLVLPTSSFSHSLNYLHSKVGSSAILTPPSLTFHTFPASHFPLPPPFAAVD
ncbi:hypothetical protein DFJ77DRAFT_276295 [Powellomyces hirtus]|nr:hypothetical protein DFJ77DRAFT_276295 [Powellomyces hirtus]